MAQSFAKDKPQANGTVGIYINSVLPGPKVRVCSPTCINGTHEIYALINYTSLNEKSPRVTATVISNP